MEEGGRELPHVVAAARVHSFVVPRVFSDVGPGHTVQS